MSPAATSPAPTAEQRQEVDTWLQRIAEQQQQIKTLRAKLVYDRIQGLLEDQQRRFGELTYIAGPPAQFAVHFDRLLVEDRLDQQDRWYIFDGRWLVERLDDRKQFTAYEIVPPDATPDEADPLALGHGPFVVPLGADVNRLRERFDVELVPGEEDDPENSVHLRLRPLPQTRIEHTQIDIWYDRDSLLPVRVRTIDDSENESIIVLRDPEVNITIDPSLIDTTAPSERGWDVSITPWAPADAGDNGGPQ